MDKLLTFPSRSERGIFTYVIGQDSKYLEKTAAAFHPTIAAYINNAKPIPGKTQILLTALGSGEIWGDNVNGDYFPERYLAYDGEEYGHRTFISTANVFKHHVNKDPNAGFGKVVVSVYNPAYHRVELIVVIDNITAGDIVSRLSNIDDVVWSMGCRVPYDECSVCGNRAPTRAQYCEHAKFMLGQIDPVTGKKIYVINHYPKFHDISYVLIQADKIARTLLKIASAGQKYPSSAELAEKSAAHKVATIEKEVSPIGAQNIDDLLEGIAELKADEPELPLNVIDHLAARPLPESMSTMAALGILPKPQEFQRIVLIQLGQRPVADELYRRNICFHPDMALEPTPAQENVLGLSCDNFSESLFRVLAPFLEQRSAAAPLLGKRIVIMAKTASARQRSLPFFVKTAQDITKLNVQGANPFAEKERKPIGLFPMLLAAAGLYAAFAKRAPDEAAKGIDKLVTNYPGLAAALGAGLVTTFGAMTSPTRRGMFSHNDYVNPDKSDVNGYVQKHIDTSVKVAGELTSRAGGAFKRLFIGIPAAYLGSGMLQKHRELNPYNEEGSIKGFVRRNPDVIGGALIADALLASRGKGTYAVTKSIAPKLRSLLGAIKTAADSNPIQKTAAIEDALGDMARGVAFPLAMGGANLPLKIAGGVFDQMAIKGLEYGVNKRKASKTV